jgi:hypothetical protein
MVKLKFRVRTMLLAIVPVALIALAIGYYLQRPRPVPVSGTVTLDGKPLGEVSVQFQTSNYGYDAKGHFAGGLPAFGVTDSAGKFQAQTFRDLATLKKEAAAKKSVHAAFDPTGVVVDGAFPGSYRVSFNKYQFPLPKRYESPTTSGLTAEVTRSGPNVFTFNLTTP